MTRLIDADELKNDLITFFPDKCLEGITTKTLFKQILTDIDNAPTVENITVFCENADEKTIEDLKAELQSVIEARPQVGWIIIKSPLSEETVVKCPYCKEEFIGNDVEDYNFCPICGKQLKSGAE